MILFTVFKIRILQLWRTILELGLIRTLFLGCLIMMILLFIHFKICIFPYNYLLPALMLLGIFYINQKRRDHYFLQKFASHSQWIKFVEYIFISLPLCIELIIHQKIEILLLFYILIFFISEWKWNISSGFFFPTTIILVPAQMFEWKSGIRRNLFILPFIFILAICGFYNIYFTFFGFLLYQIVTMSFYDQCEPRNILAVQEISANKFLRRKLIVHIRTMLKILLPLILISLVHYEYLIYIIWCIVVIINSLSLAILFKYASYVPEHSINITISIAILFALGSIIPYIFIFVFLLNCFLFIKAKQNLTTYLYDYN